MGACYSCSKAPLAKLRSRRSSGTATEATEQSVQAYGAAAYELVGQLGSGGKTGTMKLMKNKKTKELVAAKFVGRVAGAGISKNTEREIVNHRRLLHPNIIRFYEVFMTEEHLVIVMEFASGGTLEQRVATGGPMSEEKAKYLFLQLLSGMEYCHARGIFHRDLRLQNLHLHGSHFEPVLKITGFGYSKSALLDSQPKTNVGSPAYTPPELLMFTRNEGAAYDGRCTDIWSAGIILFYMLTGALPFEDEATPGALSRKMMQKIVNVDYGFPESAQLSPEVKDFIGRIFVKDPKERITAVEMRKHPWLVGTELKADDKVDESPQTELEISKIVEKARQRRTTGQARKKPGAEASQPQQNGGGNGVARGTDFELGIAEVPK